MRCNLRREQLGRRRAVRKGQDRLALAVWVVDLAMPVGSRVVAREAYYRAAKPEVAKTYSADDAVLLAIKNQHDGPWDESEQLKK